MQSGHKKNRLTWELRGKYVRLNGIINGLSPTKHSLNDWPWVRKKVPLILKGWCTSHTHTARMLCIFVKYVLFIPTHWSASVQKAEKGDDQKCIKKWKAYAQNATSVNIQPYSLHSAAKWDGKQTLWGILVLLEVGGFLCPYYSDAEVSTTCVRRDCYHRVVFISCETHDLSR